MSGPVIAGRSPMDDDDWPPVAVPGGGIPYPKEQNVDDLDQRPYGDLDLDDPTQILAEIQATAGSTSKYGIRGERPEDRIRDAARIGFLASRLAWLESTRMNTAHLSTIGLPGGPTT